MILRGIRKRVDRVPAVPVRATDARPATEPSRRRADDVAAAQSRRLHRRVVMSVLCAVFLAGSVTALFGKGGYLELRRLRREQIELQKEVDRQRERLFILRNEVEALGTDPMARERIAREQLGLARPGEITYILTEPHDSESGSGDAGRGGSSGAARAGPS